MAGPSGQWEAAGRRRALACGAVREEFGPRKKEREEEGARAGPLAAPGSFFF